MKKTYSMKPTEIKRNWFVVDASSAPLGRVASEVAALLMDKSNPAYTPHVDSGAYVIVINSDNLRTTGKKSDQKKYYRHSQYPGNLKEATLKEVIEKDSTKVISAAVRGMLPNNKLRAKRLLRLKVYKNETHNHASQKPTTVTLKESK